MITLFACLALAAPASTIHLPGAHGATATSVLESYEELFAEYEAAVASWKEQLKNAEDRAERKRVRSERPASLFGPRFAELAALGEGRALVWQLDNIRYIDVAVKARDAKRIEWYTTLFDKHAADAWFGDALTQLWGDRRRIEPAQFTAWMEVVGVKNELPEVKAQARYYASYEAVNSDEEALRTRGFAALESLIADYPETSWADQARRDLFLLRDRAVGMPAIDFEGKTVDGETFKLSDHRGKVVLLDFWGFW
jgi:hypothetical protein